MAVPVRIEDRRVDRHVREGGASAEREPGALRSFQPKSWVRIRGPIRFSLPPADHRADHSLASDLAHPGGIEFVRVSDEFGPPWSSLVPGQVANELVGVRPSAELVEVDLAANVQPEFDGRVPVFI